MFGNTANKFGTTSTFGSTGFGAATSTFGQSAPGFGVKQTTPVFGGFGAAAAPATSNMFNNTTNTPSTGLFGQSTGFGATAAPASTGFGSFGQTTTASTLFGSTSQANTGTGLFGGSATSAFGTPRPSFGGNFNTSTPSLFGQTQPQQTTGLFGQSSVSTGGLFGSSGFSAPMTSGTTVKFNPPTGTDTMMKNGVSTNINTRHQCITCMKEYENKSLEELRVEDYQANRKGPQSVGFGATTPASGGLFGSTPATSSFSFNSNQNKPSLFGSSTPGTFGTTSTPSLFGQTTQPASAGLFSKPLGFGTATTTATAAPFSFGGSTTTPLFGQAAQQKPMFGQNQTGLFGAPATSQASGVFGSAPAFGTGFGQTTQQTGILGMKPAFGAATTTSAAPFSFGTNTSTAGGSLFGPKLTATATSFPSSTGFQGFSTTPSNGMGLFNQKPATGFGATPGFGASTGLGQTGLGGLSFGNTLGGTTGTSLFGNTATANKPLNFSFGASTQPFSFGNPSANNSMTAFNPSGMGTGVGLGMDANANNLASQAQAQQQILALANYPFSDSPLFRNLIRDTNKREEILKPTNPAAQKAMLNSPKVEAHAVSKLKPKAIQPLASVKNSSTLFDGLEEEAAAFSNEIFVPRQSIKKLAIKPKLSPENKRLEESLSSPAIIDSSKSPIRQPDFSPKHNDDLLNSGRNLTALENTISELQPRNTKLFEVAHSISSDHTENEDNDDTSENFNDKNNNSPEKTSHPAGIVLTRAGYYTVPSMDTLGNMVDKDGNCFVENFAVGRENYGNVCFFGVTNVAGLNLDEIVHFQRKQIVVYMDDDNKPPVGEGLNKKAQVTLDHVFPVDKTTHLPITSPEKIVTTKFEDNLEKASLKLGAKFIEYRPETGSWVFQVPHF